MDTDGLYSTAEVEALVGATYRQLDYWDRIGVLVPAVPAHGSGSHRRYGAGQLLCARALAVLTELGAEADGLHNAAASIGTLPPEDWDGYLVVDAHGMVVRTTDPGAVMSLRRLGGAYLVDLVDCRLHVQGTPVHSGGCTLGGIHPGPCNG